MPRLYKELDSLAQQQANQGAAFVLPAEMQALLCNPEVFTVALFSEGWTEAALQLQNPGLLSADFPDWVPPLYINGLRQNRGNKAAIQFAAEQKPNPTIALLKAEIEIAEGMIDQAVPDLEKIKEDPSDIGSRAAGCLALSTSKTANTARQEKL